ncbi:hypothetical protein JCM8097_000956 [Rhodosporidiobolus ruineniae]
MSAHPSGSSHAPSRRRPPPQTLDPETAHERHQRIYRLKQAYEHGRAPPSKPTRTELDVIKERHQFIHDGNVDPANLSWEDQLALQYYNSLFREYALVNLKHYRTGQIALRWRTEPEVLSGIGHLTCGSLRCSFHHPSASLGLASSPYAVPLPEDEDDDAPLVPVVLHETSMQRSRQEEEEAERDDWRRSRSTAVEEKQDDGGEESDYGPALPPDLEQPKREQSRSGRRSASPERERERVRERRRSRSER